MDRAYRPLPGMAGKKMTYSYRNDPSVPAFDDSHPILIFDAICVLCSGGAGKMMGWDKAGKFRYATAQSNLGNALLRHYGCDATTFNTVLIVADGRGYTKSDAYLEAARQLGDIWNVVLVFRLLPKFIRDPLYDWKARNRYNWFGKTDYCKLLPLEYSARIIDR